MNKTNDNTDDLEAWQNAQGYAGLFGEIPATFSSVVRALKVDIESGKLSDGSIYLVQRLLRSKAVLSPFYFGIEEFAKYSNIEVSPLSTLISKIKPGDLAGLLAVIYLYKRAARLCSDEEWAHITPGMTVEIDLGGRIGYAMPAVGFQTGLLTGSLRWFALGAFLLHDKKGFIEYRRLLKQKNNIFDLDWERARWGCTSSQVAAVFLQSFGFGVDAVNGLAAGLSQNPPELALKDKSIYRSYITSVWIQSLRTTAAPPDISHRGEFYPDAKELSFLTEDAQRLRDKGSSMWIAKTKDDIPAKALSVLLPGVTTEEPVEEEENLEPT